MAWQNQLHNGDLLLIHLNGFYQEDILLFNTNSEKKLKPYVLGPGSEGHSERAHYSFIHKYRTTNIHAMSHKDYVRQFVMEKWDKEVNDRNTELMDIEETTIQLEMLVYLKFWEADLMIKKLYQFVRIINGQSYDWCFKVSESSREKSATGTRQDIIRLLIRDKLKEHSPALSQIIKDTYKTQIRNSIAHSNYSFLGRHIHLNNFIKEDPHSQIRAISFDEWIDIFHNTLVIYNEFIRMSNLINENYAKIASDHENTMEILITENNGEHYSSYVEYRKEWNDWKFKQLH